MNFSKPKDFGKFWGEGKYEDKDFVEWYKWMYDSRIAINKAFIDWALSKDINSIADFGCGIGIGFNEAFKDKEYIGSDISQRNIDWANKNNTNPKHSYICSDFITEPLDAKVDVVHCNGTLDCVWNINKALESLVNNTNKWIYASCCYGWHPELDTHQYIWVDDQKVYSNLTSPIEAKRVLKDLGCKNIKVFPMEKDTGNMLTETIIIAEK
tara:strand:- start:6555 stop:7187 length:633 start_codon:yes stop_codon:yes gene_type:complete